MLTDLKDAVKEVIEAFVGRRLDLLAFYPAVVVRQNSDGTLDVRCEESKLGDIARAPIRYPLPGIKATVQPQTTVFVGFEQADKARPYVRFSGAGVTIKLEIDANEIVFNGGTKQVARVDDAVAVGTLSGSVAAAPGPVLFIFTPTGGLPSLPLVTIPLSAKVAAGALGVKA